MILSSEVIRAGVDVAEMGAWALPHRRCRNQNRKAPPTRLGAAGTQTQPSPLNREEGTYVPSNDGAGRRTSGPS